jgi:hypothetical protein
MRGIAPPNHQSLADGGKPLMIDQVLPIDSANGGSDENSQMPPHGRDSRRIWNTRSQVRHFVESRAHIPNKTQSYLLRLDGLDRLSVDTNMQPKPNSSELQSHAQGRSQNCFVQPRDSIRPPADNISRRDSNLGQSLSRILDSAQNCKVRRDEIEKQPFRNLKRPAQCLFQSHRLAQYRRRYYSSHQHRTHSGDCNRGIWNSGDRVAFTTESAYAANSILRDRICGRLIRCKFEIMRRSFEINRNSDAIQQAKAIIILTKRIFLIRRKLIKIGRVIPVNRDSQTMVRAQGIKILTIGIALSS